MPERPKYLLDRDRSRRADARVGRSDAAYGKQTMSRPWQAYNQMQIMQNQANPDLDRLKAVRRDWNRNLKYTPAGMAVSGATSPLDAQQRFMDTTETFRQANKPAYNKMYPLTGGFMDYTEGGGLPGLIFRGLTGEIGKMGKDIASATGITGAIDDTPEEQDDYVARTFGFYPTDVHPGLSSIEGPMEQSEVIYSPHGPTYYDRAEGLDFEDDPNQPYVAPDDYVEDDFGAFYTDENTLAPERGLPFDDSAREDFIRRQNEVIPEPLPIGSPDPQGDFPVPEYTGPLPNISIEFGDPDIPPIVPFDDTGRETGIASLYGQGPSWAETDRRYEDEYRDYIARTGDRTTYEEFARAYERMHQGKPHAGLR